MSKAPYVLVKALTGLASFDKFHPWLLEPLISSHDEPKRLNELIDMAAYSEESEPITKDHYEPLSIYTEALEGITHYGNGVYSFPYLSPKFCADLMTELNTITYEVNEDEPPETQIPEVVLCGVAPSLYECLRSLWSHAGIPLAKLLLGLDPERLVSIQAAKYDATNTAQGHWHTDRDSDVTLVVALTDTHEGGGTTVYQGPFKPTLTVPQLPVGHAMLFCGKSQRHYGLPVTEGQRNLLVHWSETK